jgi:hypothetical protein
LDSSPKRIDIHRAVQAEQRPFQRRIDRRLQFIPSSEISRGPLHVFALAFAHSPLRCLTLDSATL